MSQPSFTQYSSSRSSSSSSSSSIRSANKRTSRMIFSIVGSWYFLIAARITTVEAFGLVGSFQQQQQQQQRVQLSFPECGSFQSHHYHRRRFVQSVPRSAARSSIHMGLFRSGRDSGLGIVRPPRRFRDWKLGSNHFRGLGKCSRSATKRVSSLAKHLSNSTRKRVGDIPKEKRVSSILATCALLVSIISASHSSIPTSSSSSHTLLAQHQPQQHDNLATIVMPSKTLQLSGGSNTGSQMINKSNYISNKVHSRNSKTNKSNNNIGKGPGPTTLGHGSIKNKSMLASVLPKSNKNNHNGQGMAAIGDATRQTTRTFRSALDDLRKFMNGPKSDTMLLLLATALITPICIQLGTSPILGFLFAGMLLGPNGWGLISGVHATETLAELGIVFFLFEMGIELSVERLMSMKKDVFGLGLLQFTATALAVAGIGSVFTSLSGAALVVLGGGLALSSSAFVLQLLKDRDQLATRFGRASFGVLLFQDLAVVPLLVVTPILAGGGRGLAAALGNALVKATMALGSIAFAGRVVLNPMFKLVAQANSQEAFLGVILLTVLSMSFMTEGLGLSNTLGAFLAGVLLSETKYRYQVEADIAPFRGILLGLFFVTVGFEIDLHLIASTFPLIPGIALAIVTIKALILTLLSLAFKLSFANAQQTGLILSQGGEFAFVAFALARGLGIFDEYTTKVLLTSISLTMAVTPFLTETGAKFAKKLEENSDFSHYLGQDQDAIEIKESDDFVSVIGYGVVGKVVCDLLDRKFIKYVGLEIDPNKAIEARNRGLPVFYGDIGRSEVMEAFNIGKAKAVIVTIASKPDINRVVTCLRRSYPDLKIFARAVNADHAQRLQSNLDVAAMVPILPEDNVLLILPFGGAVLKALGSPAEEVNAILEKKRKEVLSGRGLSVNEEETVLLQLGITTEKTDTNNNNSGSSSSSSSDSQDAPSKGSGDVTEPEKNPMVAQVIQANTIPKEPEKTNNNSNVVEAVVENEEEDEESIAQ